MKLPEDSRVWIGGGVAAAVVVVAGGWFGLIHPELSTISDEHAAAAAAITSNDALQAQVTTLRTESRQISSLVKSLAVARDQLPIEADLPTFIRQLGTQARAADVGITNLSIGAVSVSTAAGSSGTTAGTTGTTDSTTDGTTGGSATDGSTGTSTTTSSTAVAPVAAAGPAGELFQIQVTITTSGTFARQQAFLTALQNPASRAALITSAELASAATTAGAASTPSAGTEAAESGATAPTSIADSSELTTLMDVFVAPQTPAAAAELNKQLATRTTR